VRVPRSIHPSFLYPEDILKIIQTPTPQLNHDQKIQKSNEESQAESSSKRPATGTRSGNASTFEQDPITKARTALRRLDFKTSEEIYDQVGNFSQVDYFSNFLSKVPSFALASSSCFSSSDSHDYLSQQLIDSKDVESLNDLLIRNSSLEKRGQA